MQSPLQKELDELEAQIANHNKASLNVSKWDVAKQIEHCTAAIGTICKALTTSNPSEFKSSFNLTWKAISATGWIPRGAGKAPKVSQPEGGAAPEKLQEYVQKCREKLAKIPQLDKNAFFAHPYFGNLHRDDAVKFMRIHTRHHLKIIKDIVKKAR